MSDQKTHWKKLHNPDYLGAWDFQPDEIKTLTIDTVGIEKVQGSDGKKEDCAVARFKGNTKPMILNVTNSKMIEKLYDSPYIEDWKGKLINVRVVRIKAFGEFVSACRVMDTKPAPTKEELTPTHSRWAGAKKAISEGSVTIEQILKQFSVSKPNQELLCSK